MGLEGPRVLNEAQGLLTESYTAVQSLLRLRSGS